MRNPNPERRLAAVLMADVEGYTRLMGGDEAGTHAGLKAVRREIIDPSVKRHNGRLVKSTGDGLLIEFPSAVEAVACAVEVQRAMLVRNAEIPESKRIVFRVGLNVGDLLSDEGDIIGDAVNIAARLERLCVPGGICISRAVRDQIRDRLPYAFDDLGEQQVKNVTRPVRAFQVHLDTSPGEQPPELNTPSHGWLPWKIAGAAVMAATVTAVAWWSWPWDGSVPKDHTGAAQVAQSPAGRVTNQAVRPPLPRLSIIVLPFVSLNDDPGQDAVADGITDDLLTDISRIPGSFVIARNVAFTYKRKAVDVKEIGRDLGVRYALEGSVRRVGNMLRVNAQLADTQTGEQLWADRFDGETAKLPELQADVTNRIARALDLALTDAEIRRGQRERPGYPDAVDLTLQGLATLNGPLTRDNVVASLHLFGQALRIDLDHIDAMLGFARASVELVNLRVNVRSAAEVLGYARAKVAQAVALAPQNAHAHWAQAELLSTQGRHDEAREAYRTTIALNPTLANVYAKLAANAVFTGRAQESFAYVDHAIRLSPRDPQLHVFSFQRCHGHAHLAEWDAAIEWCRKSVALAPFWIAYIDLISSYGWKGMRDEAQAAIIELHKLLPNYTVRRWAQENWSSDPIFIAEDSRIIEGLRKGGLPEE
jgi:adenylate cyclase